MLLRFGLEVVSPSDMDTAAPLADNGWMRPGLTACCVLASVSLVLSLLWPERALAETRRVALVVGNNAGAPGRKALRYAESDAGKVARVWNELGGVTDDDLWLLQGQGVRELERALSMLTARVAELHRKPDERIVLLFYFSGHSDGTALELGADRLGYGDLKHLLEGTGAEVKVAIVDSCQSGGLLATKGGRAGSGFDVNLTDELATHGSVFLTSSAADEYALESAEVQGSYFTHHFVSGLRGAADASGDGRVTLAEAYRYAFDHTVASTADTTVGPQHPRFDYQLAGQGELVLTELRDHPTSGLTLPDGLSRALVMDLTRDQVVAEVGQGSLARLSMAPGRYSVRVWRGRQVLFERLELKEHEERRLQWSELVEEPLTVAVSKGGVESASAPSAEVVGSGPGIEHQEPAPLAGLLVQGGAELGMAVPVVGGLRLGLENMNPSGIGFALVGSTGIGAESSGSSSGSGSAGSFREDALVLRSGARLGTDAGRARLFASLELGLGATWRMGSRSGASPLAQLGPRLGLRFRLSHRTFVTLETEMMGSAAYLDKRVLVAAQPSAMLGLELGIF
jgi:hypothetical protein